MKNVKMRLFLPSYVQRLNKVWCGRTVSGSMDDVDYKITFHAVSYGRFMSRLVFKYEVKTDMHRLSRFGELQYSIKMALNPAYPKQYLEGMMMDKINLYFNLPSKLVLFCEKVSL